MDEAISCNEIALYLALYLAISCNDIALYLDCEYNMNISLSTHLCKYPNMHTPSLTH